MICVKTPKFTLMGNGSLNGLFESRLMKKIQSNIRFSFHPRCRKVELNHLIFTDDIILGCSGKFPVVLYNVTSILATSGLKVSESKSNFYKVGVHIEDIRRIWDATSFAHSRLPFKYLGVPICSIKTIECRGTIEKMVARIKVWSLMNLSYAGRLQLINSILISIHVYWAQFFILPKVILKEIAQICRAFLYCGNWFRSKLGNIKRQYLCASNQTGGWGLERLFFGTRLLLLSMCGQSMQAR